MEISWLGHSCFRIKSGDVIVITDPYSPDIGYTLGKQTARIVTVSHDHPGHSHIAGVDGQPQIVSRPGEYEISDVLIIGIATYHDREAGAVRGKNTVFLMEIDGLSVCHLGDLGHALTAGQAEEIDTVDVLLLPVGGLSTIDAAMAAEVVRQLEPRVVIPMHYQTPALNRPLDGVDKFLKEIGAKPTDPLPKLSLNRTSLAASNQIFLLDYPH